MSNVAVQYRCIIWYCIAVVLNAGVTVVTHLCIDYRIMKLLVHINNNLLNFQHFELRVVIMELISARTSSNPFKNVVERV